MVIHTASCQCNYVNSNKYYTVEAIRAVYGKSSLKLFLVKWEGYGEDENSWVTEDSLLCDGFKEIIDNFSGLNLTQ